MQDLHYILIGTALPLTLFAKTIYGVCIGNEKKHIVLVGPKYTILMCLPYPMFHFYFSSIRRAFDCFPST
ncbi:hypothetical protein QBC43DRAFT_322754 [Cladorrhinum sp. PSN259]|nr:hypothetical protein QBC43DRAFT_322754 [Cladorrhinum sp. PSN259]